MGLLDAYGNTLGGILVAVEPNIQGWLRNGQAFSATTGLLATATNANLTIGGMCIFNPANSGKSVLIYSMHVFTTVTSICRLNAVTADEAFGNPLTPNNMNLAGGTSVVTCNSSANSVAASVTRHGIELAIVTQGLSSAPNDVITNGGYILLPIGSAHGVAVYPFVATAGNNFAVNAKWIEF